MNENGGVLKQVSASELKEERRNQLLIDMAQAIPDLLGDNAEDYSVHDFSRGNDDAHKLFREQLVEMTQGKKKDVGAAFSIAIDMRLITSDSVKVQGCNKPKQVPRALQTELDT